MTKGNKLKDKLALGKALRKCRKDLHETLASVTEELERKYDVQCSITNLAKVERGEFQAKSNLIAALCLIYKVDPKEILYK